MVQIAKPAWFFVTAIRLICGVNCHLPKRKQKQFPPVDVVG
jgi:hypothetical protein